MRPPLLLVLVPVLAAAEPPPCMGPLVCPAGTKSTKVSLLESFEFYERCQRPNGQPHGPAHARFWEGGGFICWEFKDGLHSGPSRTFWPTGFLKVETTDFAFPKKRRDAWFDPDGKPVEVVMQNGLNVDYFPNGSKRCEGTIKSTRQGSQREGVWTRWFENGNKQFECTFVSGARSGPCAEWAEDGKVLHQAVYADGRLESGEEVGVFFYEDEPPLAASSQKPSPIVPTQPHPRSKALRELMAPKSPNLPAELLRAPPLKRK